MEKKPEKYASEFGQSIPKLEAVFARELTPDLAHRYIGSLIAKLGGIDQSYSDFIEKGKALHFWVGQELYGPLIVGYCQWVHDQCASLGYQGNVYFALRDAAPLKVVADVLWGNSKLTPVGIYANRPLLGIEDEIAPETSKQNGKVLEYLAHKGLSRGEQVLWVDTGAWGTVIKALKTSVLASNKLYPLFWFSHNPAIPGYLNTMLVQAGIDPGFGEILNDSMECMFPQKWLRPISLSADATEAVLMPSDYLSTVWGQAALDGVHSAAMQLHAGITPEEQVGQLHKLYWHSQEAKETGNWGGVLPENTPTWSKGAEFLADWPKDLLP